MLVQSVGCEDADTTKSADKSASLFVLNLLSSEVLCFESTPAEQIQFSCHMDALQAFHAV